MRPNLRLRTRAHRSRWRAAVDLVGVPQLRQGFRDQGAFGIRLVCYMEWFRAHFFLSRLARQRLIPLGRSFLSLSMFKDIYQLCGHVWVLNFTDYLT